MSRCCSHAREGQVAGDGVDVDIADEEVRAEPFDAVELDLALLWR